MKDVKEVIEIAEATSPGSTRPGRKSGNTVLEPPVRLKHLPTEQVVTVTAVSVNKDTPNMALVREFFDQIKWWIPIDEFEPVPQ